MKYAIVAVTALAVAIVVTYGGTVAAFDRNGGKEFGNSLHNAHNYNPTGIWSDGSAMWVADWDDGKLYAYDRDGKGRVVSKEFDGLRAAGNDNPTGIWSDGSTMWVADSDDDKLYAYLTGSRAWDTSRDFDTLRAAGNRAPWGVWSDESTIWVADSDDVKLYAYDLASKARVAASDFNTLSAAGNDHPTGIWSDGSTMWVADAGDVKIYAYDLASKARVPSRDFETLQAANIRIPRGIWSDGDTMWVAQARGHIVAWLFAFNMPEDTAYVAPTDPVANVSVSPGAGSLTVSWRPPSGDASGITAYDLRHIRAGVDEAADANWTVVRNVWTGSGPLRYVLTGLTGGTQYKVQVRAVNSAGDGPWSATATGTPTQSGSGPQSDSLTAPTNVVATVSGSSVTVTWTDGQGAAGHLVRLYQSDLTGELRQAAAAGSSHTFRDVPPGNYIAVVIAFDADANQELATSSVVTIVAATGELTAPTNVVATVSGSSVTVTWTDGQCAAGHLVFLFRADFSSVPTIAPGAGGSHTFSNIAPGGYIAVVVALDASGAYKYGSSELATVAAANTSAATDLKVIRA